MKKNIVENAIANTTKKARKTYTEEQQARMREAGTTQGRKGCKSIKFCMSINPTAYDYVTTMSKLQGVSITKFTNDIILDSMEKNKDLYEKVVALREEIKK